MTKLDSLKLVNFRNYGEESCSFSEQLNEFYGDNAQGKSNLLEALYFLITGRSFRTHRLADLIGEGGEHFFIEVTFGDEKLSVGFDGNQRRIVHNETSFNTLTNLLGVLRGVLLCPEDRQLIAGPPAGRRRLLDMHLAQIDPNYVQHLGRYTRALKQRNQLLRKEDKATIRIWEEQLAPSAVYITKRRLEAVEELAKSAAHLYKELSPEKGNFAVSYRPTLQDLTEEGYLEACEKHRKREEIIGHTFTGPHRDELTLTLNSKEARLFGSEGEKGSCILSLRLAEWESLYNSSGIKPLLLIDDASAHFDPWRKEALHEQVCNRGQVFLASPRPLHLNRPSQRFQINQGTIKNLND